MNINSEALVSISEANQNFSRVARLADTHGSAVILKNNTPRYVVLPFNALTEPATYASDEEVLAVSRRLLQRNKKVYEELAK